MRGHNITGKPLDVTLRPVGAGLRPAPQARPDAALANLAEEPLNPLDVGEDGAVHFTANGHEVVTVRFW